MPAVGHDESDVVSAGLHHVSDKGVAKAVASESVDSTVVQFCQLCGITARSCDRMVEG
jgi:hypothetical protein